MYCRSYQIFMQIRSVLPKAASRLCSNKWLTTSINKFYIKITGKIFLGNKFKPRLSSWLRMLSGTNIADCIILWTAQQVLMSAVNNSRIIPAILLCHWIKLPLFLQSFCERRTLLHVRNDHWQHCYSKRPRADVISALNFWVLMATCCYRQRNLRADFLFPSLFFMRSNVYSWLIQRLDGQLIEGLATST